jgi:uncharacterized protein (TIGR00661 family)
MKVLVAPLNWGIGHATRSIPIIEEHLNKGNNVFIASSGEALQLLKSRFPFLSFYELPDYGITYHKYLPVWLSVCLQGGRILNSIKQEHEITTGLHQEHKFDLIISDNRYGVYNKTCLSQLICHQLNPIAPNRFFQRLSEYIHKTLCKHFDEILVPDYPDIKKRLSGQLSLLTWTWTPKIIFINPLSQLNVPTSNNLGIDGVLVMLSGVEPQRTILEHKLIHHLKTITHKLVIVGGKLTGVKSLVSHGVYHSFLNKTELERELSDAKYIICRSGYSTIMDLHQLKDKIIIFIPTPGQTEQEYLAKYLSKKYSNMFYCSQNNLRVIELIENITNNH